MPDGPIPDAVTVSVVFHTPFRVAGGSANDGVDATYRADNPLPASTLKGLMRSQASRILGLSKPVVQEVFGSELAASPWWWSDAELIDTRVSVRTQLRIDDESGTAANGAVRTADQLWPSGARFVVARRDAVPAHRLSAHLAVLEASARSVTALGESRRRGMGWVSLRPDRPWDAERQALLLALRQEGS